MTKPSVRLVTCSHLPDLAPDDQELLAALRRSGVPTAVAIWDDLSVDWAQAPITVIRSVFDYHLRRDEFLTWLSKTEFQTQIQNTPETIRWNSHKSYLLQWRAAGFPIIPTEWVEAGSEPDLENIMRRQGWSEVVAKPAVSASAHRTLKVGDHNLSTGIRHLKSLAAEGDALVQPYLYEFESIGESSVIWLGGRQTHSVRRPSGIHTSLENAHIGAPLTPSQPELELAHWAYETISPEPLYARIDMIDTAEYGLLLLELELIEPALYLRHSKLIADQFAAAVASLVPNTSHQL